MSSSLPISTKGYTIDFNAGGFDGLHLSDSLPVAALGPHDCLIAIDAVSLNYRDIAMALGVYPAPTKREQVIPCSDGAGTILAIGSDVQDFKPGDRVCATFFQDFEDGVATKAGRASSLGGLNDGVLRRHAVFADKGLVKIPNYLTKLEASTLPCAALTAWNALFGVEGRRQLKPGDWVLTQGTGGVSIFSLLFAKALGAHVVATTGGGDGGSKEQRLRDLGADEVINYRADANWGTTAREFIEKHGGSGAQHVIEVGGEVSMEQSFKVIAGEGIISIIGFLGGGLGGDGGEGSKKKTTGLWDCFTSNCLVRGVIVGSRRQFRDMLAFMEEKGVNPVVDEKVWTFDQAREAYEYLHAQKFFGKVVIDLQGVE